MSNMIDSENNWLLLRLPWFPPHHHFARPVRPDRPTRNTAIGGTLYGVLPQIVLPMFASSSDCYFRHHTEHINIMAGHIRRLGSSGLGLPGSSPALMPAPTQKAVRSTSMS